MPSDCAELGGEIGGLSVKGHETIATHLVVVPDDIAYVFATDGHRAWETCGKLSAGAERLIYLRDVRLASCTWFCFILRGASLVPHRGKSWSSHRIILVANNLFAAVR